MEERCFRHVVRRFRGLLRGQASVGSLDWLLRRLERSAPGLCGHGSAGAGRGKGLREKEGEGGKEGGKGVEHMGSA